MSAICVHSIEPSFQLPLIPINSVFQFTMASSSTASSYDVFLNHRGPDRKNTFASLLYRGLASHGLKVFLDREELLPGSYFRTQIKEAIRTASVHVVIFSPRYAESSWCLNELLLILESKDATIIPVFYNVKPSELRRTMDGNCQYGESLHVLAKRHNPNIIESWRKALLSVSLISGFELEACNGDEGELTDIVIKVVLQKVQKVPGSHAYVAEYRAGLDEKVKDFENEVFFKHHQSAKPPQVVGIVGLGGVGKTTLAKEFLDRKMKLSHNSRKSCFLSNVRENKGILTDLQIQLLKILTGSDVPIHSIDQGKEALKKSLSSSSVLLVLDDVDDVDQIDALVPVRTNIHSESLIVITTRDKRVIEKAPIYQLTGLNKEHSLELFCTHAFNQPFAPTRFESLVNKFLKFCVGLPLFLRVFGALLSEKEYESEWEEVLDRLHQEFPNDIEKSIQISYDSLDTEQQQMFLDCACFFRGQKRDTAIRIWDGSGWEGRLGFQTLQNRCLLEVDIENIIHMHDHLRDFGRALAVTSQPRRLWHCTHMNAMLEQLPGTSVRGIRMVLGEYKDDVNAFGRIDMNTLQLVDTENAILERILGKPMLFPNLLWFRWNKFPETSMALWIPKKNLRVLQVSGSELRTLWEDEPQAPLQLRELEVNAPLSNIPKSIGLLDHLESIVIGGFLSGQVNLTKLPEEFCYLRSLKALVLTECSKMKSLPDSFADLGNLQHINFSFCRNLERLPDSFGDLGRLQHINLSYCHDLEKLPDSICRLRRLQHINLRGCHNLESLPDSFVNLKDEEFDLRRINLSGCHDLERLPDSFGNFMYLQHIDLQGCHNLEKLPNSFGNLKNLEHINFSNCHDLEKLPESFGNLSNLQYIDLSGCHNLERLPNYFGNLTKLKYLDVEGCSNLIIETLELSDRLGVAQKRQLEQLYLSDAEPVLPEMRNGKLTEPEMKSRFRLFCLSFFLLIFIVVCLLGLKIGERKNTPTK